VVTVLQQARLTLLPGRIPANHRVVVTLPRRTDVLPSTASGDELYIVVYNNGHGKSRSACSCGWRGRYRHIRSIAVLDALMHAARAGCDPAAPLVIESHNRLWPQ
jgi:hypothetical protein